MKHKHYSRIIGNLVIMLSVFHPAIAQQNTWVQKADFFEAREGAASFTINDKLYVGTGDEKNDLWEYNPATNLWTQKASLPSVGRSYAVGFSIGNKGYIATGVRKSFNIIDSLMSDVWEYDPVADSWTRKADFAGGRRARAVVFVLDNKAYVGSGENLPAPIMAPEYPNRVAQDFWSFDPENNTWSRVADIPMRRMNAIAFSNNGRGFVGTGFYNTYTQITPVGDSKFYPGDDLQDLWAYNPSSNNWLQKSSFPGGKRMGMSVFKIGDTAYTIAGAEVAGRKYWTTDTDIMKKDVWAYNTVTETWVQKTDFSGSARRYAIAAAIAGYGYFGTGKTNDLWAYVSNSTVLPVGLISFAGTLQNSTTKLMWVAANEQKYDHYQVEESVDGIAFTTAGEVKATNQKQYVFEKKVPAQNGNLYYRLRIVDRDGSFNYSNIINFAAANAFDGVALFPSPLKENFGYLRFTSTTTKKLQVNLLDMLGHQLSTQSVNVLAGFNKVPLLFNNLKVGTYFLQVMNEKNYVKTIRFLKL